jgi:urea carboxylase
MAVQLDLERESLARLEAANALNGGGNNAGPADDAGAGGDDPAWDAPGRVKVAAGFTANVWDVKVKVGDEVQKGDTLVVLEAMKMESPVLAPVAGRVAAVPAEQGALAAAGQSLVVLEKAQ